MYSRVRILYYSVIFVFNLCVINDRMVLKILDVTSVPKQIRMDRLSTVTSMVYTFVVYDIHL